MGGEGIAEEPAIAMATSFDECGVCGGDGIAEGECDCDGNVLDEWCGGEGTQKVNATATAMC